MIPRHHAQMMVTPLSWLGKTRGAVATSQLYEDRGDTGDRGKAERLLRWCPSAVIVIAMQKKGWRIVKEAHGLGGGNSYKSSTCKGRQMRGNGAVIRSTGTSDHDARRPGYAYFSLHTWSRRKRIRCLQRQKVNFLM